VARLFATCPARGARVVPRAQPASRESARGVLLGDRANLQCDEIGALGDDRGVPLLLEWSAPGKDFDTRSAAISGLTSLDPKNKAITQALISYLQEPYIDIKLSSIFALTRRGDPDAIPALEALVKSGDLALGTGPMIQNQIDALKAKAAAAAAPPTQGTQPSGSGTPTVRLNTR